jgi:hypothetical protein
VRWWLCACGRYGTEFLRNADKLLSISDEDEARLSGRLQEKPQQPQHPARCANEEAAAAADGGGTGVDVQFRENGYLFLASPQGRPVLESNHQLQRDLGSDIRFLGSPSEIKAQFPYLHTDVRVVLCVCVCVGVCVVLCDMRRLKES